MEIIYFAKWILLESGEVLLNGALSVDGATITAVGPRSKVRKNCDSRIVNLGDVLLLPGFINMHMHLEESPFRGTPRNIDDTFAAYTAKKNTRLKSISKEQTIASMRLTVKEILSQGITSILDSSRFGHSALVLKDEPLRSWIIHELHADDKIQEDATDALLNTLQFNNDVFPKHAIGPYALFSLSPSCQQKVISFAERNDSIWAMHIAESAEELQAFSEKAGDLYFYTTRKQNWNYDNCTMGSMHYALSNNLIPSNGICFHCNYVNGQELSTLAEKNVSIVICFTYTQEMGHKTFPLDSALKRNCNICIGTEGTSPHGSLSLFDELFALKMAYPHISAKDFLMMVTRNPAQALRADNYLGSLSEGKLADFIAVRFAYDGSEDILEELLMTEPEIALVVINGEEIIYNC